MFIKFQSNKIIKKDFQIMFIKFQYQRHETLNILNSRTRSIHITCSMFAFDP